MMDTFLLNLLLVNSDKSEWIFTCQTDKLKNLLKVT